MAKTVWEQNREIKNLEISFLGNEFGKYVKIGKVWSNIEFRYWIDSISKNDAIKSGIG